MHSGAMYVSHETIPSCCASHKKIWIREGNFNNCRFFKIYGNYNFALEETCL